MIAAKKHSSILEQVNLLRIKVNSDLDPKTKASLGQFFTQSPICIYMSSLFTRIYGNVKLLDPGCGPGSLAASFVDEALKRGNVQSIVINAIDIDGAIEPFITEALALCAAEAAKFGVTVAGRFYLEDFILTYSANSGLFTKDNDYTHVIMNPPYKKIATKSAHRKALKSVGIETVNLYTGFLALAINKLAVGGELVAIVPRSFCNGPYYQAFREKMLQETAIQKIHIFDSRVEAFFDDNVLQENVIIHLIKGIEQGDVIITSSPGADFGYDEKSGRISATDLTIRTVPFKSIVHPRDKQKFIHIVTNEQDQAAINRLALFNTSLEENKLHVSTGPIVDFRLKNDLRKNLEENTVPLIYPVHLNGGINWPKESKKPNAIAVSDESRNGLWQNTGYFVIVRRFSSKEEKRRIMAIVYDSSLPGNLIGFDNKLNVYHVDKKGFDRETALGLYVYLNSSLLDKYYRFFSGHTQINVTDLRSIHYPNIDSLRRMGNEVKTQNMNQKQIDEILDREITSVAGITNNSA
jgi:adenine-specific DNA-methyltransferase